MLISTEGPVFSTVSARHAPGFVLGPAADDPPSPERSSRGSGAWLMRHRPRKINAIAPRAMAAGRRSKSRGSSQRTRQGPCKPRSSKSRGSSHRKRARPRTRRRSKSRGSSQRTRQGPCKPRSSKSRGSSHCTRARPRTQRRSKSWGSSQSTPPCRGCPRSHKGLPGRLLRAWLRTACKATWRRHRRRRRRGRRRGSPGSRTRRSNESALSRPPKCSPLYWNGPSLYLHVCARNRFSWFATRRGATRPARAAAARRRGRRRRGSCCRNSSERGRACRRNFNWELHLGGSKRHLGGSARHRSPRHRESPMH